MSTYYLMQCKDCGCINEGGAFRHSAGDESLDICPDCRSVENAKEVGGCEVCNPKCENDRGESTCTNCEGKGWFDL